MSMDAGGGHREITGGNVAGVARRPDHERGVLDVAICRADPVVHGRRQRGTVSAAATIRARAYAFGCSTGNLAERRNGFDDDSALCLAGNVGATENIFNHLSRTEF